MATLSRYISWGRNHIATGIATDIATDIATTSQPTCNHIATTVANHAAADIAGKASEAGERRATLVATRLPTLPGAGLAHVWDACSDARWFFGGVARSSQNDARRPTPPDRVADALFTRSLSSTGTGRKRPLPGCGGSVQHRAPRGASWLPAWQKPARYSPPPPWHPSRQLP